MASTPYHTVANYPVAYHTLPYHIIGGARIRDPPGNFRVPYFVIETGDPKWLAYLLPVDP